MTDTPPEGVSSFDSFLDDDGFASGDFIAVEAPVNGKRQALWIGIRPVWSEEGPSRRPMIQICYQEDYLKAPLAGPVWLSEQTWDQIVDAVDWRLSRKLPLWKRYLRKLAS